MGECGLTFAVMPLGKLYGGDANFRVKRFGDNQDFFSLWQLVVEIDPNVENFAPKRRSTVKSLRHATIIKLYLRAQRDSHNPIVLVGKLIHRASKW